MIRSIFVVTFVVAICSVVLWLANTSQDPAVAATTAESGVDVPTYVLSNFEEQTGARNAVAAIYLNYRVYDTLFEALLLLIAIVGIIHFFRIGIRSEPRSIAAATHRPEKAYEQSDIISRITGFLYPVVILFGFYVIANGHNTPGGGFQGGAILATLFIGRFIVNPVNDVNAEVLHDVEQALFVMILLVPVIFLFYEFSGRFPALNEPFLILMNVLIGIKVCLGLTIVVFRFGFDEENL